MKIYLLKFSLAYLQYTSSDSNAFPSALLIFVAFIIGRFIPTDFCCFHNRKFHTYYLLLVTWLWCHVFYHGLLEHSKHDINFILVWYCPLWATQQFSPKTKGPHNMWPPLQQTHSNPSNHLESTTINLQDLPPQGLRASYTMQSTSRTTWLIQLVRTVKTSP